MAEVVDSHLTQVTASGCVTPVPAQWSSHLVPDDPRG